jgi:hypothetical protein
MLWRAKTGDPRTTCSGVPGRLAAQPTAGVHRGRPERDEAQQRWRPAWIHSHGRDGDLRRVLVACRIAPSARPPMERTRN